MKKEDEFNYTFNYEKEYKELSKKALALFKYRLKYR